MKKRNIAYWVVTALFSAFMIFSAVPDIMMVPDAMKFIGHLGYPDYFIPFIGVAKLLGSIAILIPGFPRIKEWAYAGLFFDLVGAVYSILRTDGVDFSMLFMVLPFGLLFTSYFMYHNRLDSNNDSF
ncbi:MAG: DoxX family protein [Chitinophagaceae bacterium]